MLVACATAYAWFARIQIKTVTQEKSTLQARSVAFLLSLEVMKGLRLVTGDSDSLHDPWFQPMLIPLTNYGFANVGIKPLDDKIPIQHLFLPDGTTLRNELSDVWDKMWLELEVRTSIPAIVLDYIDRDTIPRLGGRDGPGNLNRNLLDISELLGIPEITAELLYGKHPKLGIADYCTMWSGSKININTAEHRVLFLLRGMNRHFVEEIIKLREKKEIASFEDLREIPGFPGTFAAVNQNLIGFTSEYYSLRIELMDENWSSSRYFDIVLRKSDGRILRWEEM
jgi:type II secretory pathway component PulK